MLAATVVSLASCGGSSTDDNATSGDTSQGNLTNPTAIDTTKHPDGMINGSVISTDTAAMNMQNSVNKAKAAENK